jgi:hypothetical protein
MARRYVFADEAGNFDVSPKGSRYFILTSVSMDDCAIAQDLLGLRRDLAWRGVRLRREFHATEDAQSVRNEVFRLLANHGFRIDATIVEKAKTLPGLRPDDGTFYVFVWYRHIKHVIRKLAKPQDELLVVAASAGTQMKQEAVSQAVEGAMRRFAPSAQARVAVWSAACEPCLQIADYCCWAIQRKWEGGDLRSYVLVREKIATEFDVFAIGTEWHYGVGRTWPATRAAARESPGALVTGRLNRPNRRGIAASCQVF